MIAIDSVGPYQLLNKVELVNNVEWKGQKKTTGKNLWFYYQLVRLTNTP